MVDGGSSDQTVPEVLTTGVKLVRSKKGRAAQMNAGARSSNGDILYFLHADTFPPQNFRTSIANAVLNNREAGCFELKFDSGSQILRFFERFTSKNWLLARGGDQSLWITKDLFKRINGFDTTLRVMEDIDIVRRINRTSQFSVLPQKVITSDRKYRQHGMIRLQLLFGLIHLMYWCGVPSSRIYKAFNSILTREK